MYVEGLSAGLRHADPLGDCSFSVASSSAGLQVSCCVVLLVWTPVLSALEPIALPPLRPPSCGPLRCQVQHLPLGFEPRGPVGPGAPCTWSPLSSPGCLPVCSLSHVEGLRVPSAPGTSLLPLSSGTARGCSWQGSRLPEAPEPGSASGVPALVALPFCVCTRGTVCWWLLLPGPPCHQSLPVLSLISQPVVPHVRSVWSHFMSSVPLLNLCSCGIPL